MTSAGETLLILLVAGHLLGDFAFQTTWMVDRKSRPPVLVAHVAAVLLAHTIALLPLLSWSVAGLLIGIGAVHGLIDLAKPRVSRKGRGGLAVFLLDQNAHLAVLVAAWWLFLWLTGEPEVWMPAQALVVFTKVVLVLAAFAFNATGGAAVVSGVLAAQDPKLEAEAEEKKADRSPGSGVDGSGRLIGILERTLSLILILAGQWAAIVLLLAAKSIARFDDLKERRFSEYYLIGTLTSLLVAILTGMLLSAVLARL